MLWDVAAVLHPFDILGCLSARRKEAVISKDFVYISSLSIDLLKDAYIRYIINQCYMITFALVIRLWCARQLQNVYDKYFSRCAASQYCVSGLLMGQ